MKEETFVSLVEKSIKENWNSPSLSNYQEDTATYGEVGKSILRIQWMFQQAGIQPGDKVAVVGRNLTNWAVIYLATVTYGAVCVPILQDFSSHDIHHILKHSGSVMLFTTNIVFNKIDDTKAPFLKGIVSLNDFSILVDNVGGKLKETQQEGRELFEKPENTPTSETFRLPEVSNDELAVISYTSGTSGFSKGVMLTHKNLWSNVRFGLDHVNLGPGDNIVSFLPLAHAYGCLFEFLAEFAMGCHITFLTRTPSPRIITQAFQELRPRLITAVPLIIEKIYKKQILPALDKRTVKMILKVPVLNRQVYKKINKKLEEVFGGNFIQIIIGGAAFNKDVELFLKKVGFRFTVGYGMTECGPIISYSPWNEHKHLSAGKVVDRMEVKIDSNDPYNEVGEILVRGDNVMSGYYKNKEATDQTFTSDGWLKTGDLGIIDKDQVIYIKGRSKNMILGPSGQNIYPEEIENKVNNMPFVQECIVRDNGGKLEALVYPDFDSADSEGYNQEDLMEIMKENRQILNRELPRYMNLAKITLYPEEFKKTPKKSIKRYLYTK